MKTLWDRFPVTRKYFFNRILYIYVYIQYSVLMMFWMQNISVSSRSLIYSQKQLSVFILQNHYHLLRKQLSCKPMEVLYEVCWKGFGFVLNLHTSLGIWFCWLLLTTSWNNQVSGSCLFYASYERKTMHSIPKLLKVMPTTNISSQLSFVRLHFHYGHLKKF